MNPSKKNGAFLKNLFAAFVVLVFIMHPAFIYCETLLTIGHFSASTPDVGLPESWEQLTFRGINKHTIYEKHNDNGTTVIRAESNASASGLIRKISIDPKEYPIIKWRWKITNVYQSGDVTKKSGDDYPARIYIAFKYDATKVGFWEKAKFEVLKLIYGEYPPITAVNYIWESKAPKENIVLSPYTDRVRMIVVESGQGNINIWKHEERNIYEDYINAFGETPPMISGVAVMTDSDNTGESAVCFYGDIVFESKK